jgi:PTH1 family peptidyl-tRNA hydrolase
VKTGIRLIIGLGNPGAQYEKTRHNVGAWFVDYLAESHGETLRLQNKLHATSVSIQSDDISFYIAKPTVYMNHSGQSVSALAKFYKIPPESILIVHDELDFDVGTNRLKFNGGHGGHNGLRDIQNALQSASFYRLRIGIGHPGHKDQVTDYVLNPPNRADRLDIIKSFDEINRVLPMLLKGEMDTAFRELHS